MSSKKRRKHSKEFKEEAVKLVTEQGYQVSEAARWVSIPTFWGAGSGNQR